MTRKTIVNIIGLAIVLFGLAALVVGGMRERQSEEDDRLLWEEVMNFRVALEGYRNAEAATYPKDGTAMGRDGSFVRLGRLYHYRPLPEGCDRQCDDYEIIFTLTVGTGRNEKGTYRADRGTIEQVKE